MRHFQTRYIKYSSVVPVDFYLITFPHDTFPRDARRRADSHPPRPSSHIQYQGCESTPVVTRAQEMIADATRIHPNRPQLITDCTIVGKTAHSKQSPSTISIFTHVQSIRFCDGETWQCTSFRQVIHGLHEQPFRYRNIFRLPPVNGAAIILGQRQRPFRHGRNHKRAAKRPRRNHRWLPSTTASRSCDRSALTAMLTPSLCSSLGNHQRPS